MPPGNASPPEGASSPGGCGEPHAIPRRHAPLEQLVRQGSFRGFPALSGKNSPFKRQLSLRLNDLPSTLQRKTDFQTKNPGEHLRANMNEGGTQTASGLSPASMLFSINASEKKTICSYNAAYMQDFETMLYKVFACTSLSVISMYKQTVFTLMSPSTSSEELELCPKLCILEHVCITELHGIVQKMPMS